jgi:nicotinate dehydrogenase subunit B
MNTKMVSRRELLKSTGALVVGFNLFPPIALAGGAAPSDLAEPDARSLDSWLAVSRDGSVTLFTSKVELGTGVETALAQIVAEELDIALAQMKVESGDTSKTVDQGLTAGSRTLLLAGPQLRQVAAATREALLKLASGRLNVPPEKLEVKEGVVSVKDAPAHKVSYAELVGGKRLNVNVTASGTGWDLKVATEAKPKDPKTYKIVGTSVPRMDLPGKFTGEFVYSADVRLPGMLHGRAIRPATVISKPSSVDESSIAHIAGIVKIVQEGSFVGVVAQTEWAAIQAARQLKVTWSTPQRKYPSTKQEVFDYLRATRSVKDQVAVSRGNPQSELGNATKVLETTVQWPLQLHGMIGPSCAVADVRGDRATVWTGTQSPFGTRTRIAGLLGIPEKDVHVIYTEGSGSYGRLQNDDCSEDAALLSRAVGKPVRVQWSRADEHGWEMKGPAQVVTVRAALDKSGKVTAWDFLDRSFPWSEEGNPLLASRQTGLKPNSVGFGNGAGAGGEIYTFDNQKVAAALIPWVWEDPMPLRTGNLRAPGEPARSFASETIMDDLASSAGVDPVKFRLRYLTDKRLIETLNAAAKQANWEKKPSPQSPQSAKAKGRGVAIGDRTGTMTAAVAEVEVDKSTGKVSVTRITLAQDCGLIVNPDGVKNQIQGNVIQGVSRTLLEEVKFDQSGIKSLDWMTYPIIRFPDIPDIDIVLINRPEMHSLGAGEAAIVPVPAAISNAIFDAIGVRILDVPITPERVLHAISEHPPSQLS